MRRVRRFSVALGVAVALTLLSVRFQRTGPEQVVYSNLCGPDANDLCYRPVLKGGIPVAYLFDAPGISVENQLAFVEDDFHGGAFAIDVVLWLAAIIVGYSLAVRLSSRSSVVGASCLVSVAFAACAKVSETDASRSDSVPVATRDALPRSAPGVRFDAPAIRPGMHVGELVVESVNAERAVADSTYVGVAKFRGEISITGATLRHPEADQRDVSVCFEADSASAARLPRWSGDERRSWFCFENPVDAARALGPPGEGVPATIVVDRFTIHRGLSDQVNSARFVRLVRGGATTTTHR